METFPTIQQTGNNLFSDGNILAKMISILREIHPILRIHFRIIIIIITELSKVGFEFGLYPLFLL